MDPRIRICTYPTGLRTNDTKITGMIPVLFDAADIFSFAHHAWASETSSVSSAGGESGETEADISWFRSELARLRFDLQGKLILFCVQAKLSPYLVRLIWSFVLDPHLRFMPPVVIGKVFQIS
jgi:hypothetical protein